MELHLLYLVPTIFALEVAFIWFQKPEDRTILLIRKVNYLLTLVAYIYLICNLDFTKELFKEKFGIPANIWGMVIFFAVLFIGAFLLDLLMLSGRFMNEFSLFGIKAKLSGSSDTIENQKMYIVELSNRLFKENEKIGCIEDYFCQENFEEAINSGTFLIRREIERFIYQYYKELYFGAKIDVYLFYESEDIDKVALNIIHNSKLYVCPVNKLKKIITNRRSELLNNSNTGIITVNSRILDDGKQAYVVIIKSEDKLIKEDPIFIINLIHAFETETIIKGKGEQNECTR